MDLPGDQTRSFWLSSAAVWQIQTSNRISRSLSSEPSKEIIERFVGSAQQTWMKSSVWRVTSGETRWAVLEMYWWRRYEGWCSTQWRLYALRSQTVLWDNLLWGHCVWQAIVCDDTKLEKVRAISSEWRKYGTLFSIWLSRGQTNSPARETFSVITEQRQNLKQIDEPHIYSAFECFCLP